MVKVIQLNLNHCREAQDLLAQTVIEQQAEVAILSDPYKDRHEGVWQHSSDGREGNMELRAAPWTPIAKGFQNAVHQSEDQRYNILQLLHSPERTH